MKSFKNFTNEAKQTKDDFDLDDLDPVQYPALKDKYSKRNAKRQRVSLEGVDAMEELADVLGLWDLNESEMIELSDYVDEISEQYEDLNEVLNVAQRRKRAIITRRNKSKLQRGRRRQSRRIAGRERLNTRSRRQAKSNIVKKLTKGVSKQNLSPQRKAEVEKRLKKMDSRVGRLQKRILPSVRKRDRGM